MPIMETNLLHIIQLYESQVIRADKFLRSLYAPLDLHPLQASYVQIPQRDTLFTPDGEVSYNFHGKGCVIIFEDYGVDFDFWHLNPIIEFVRFSYFNLDNFMWFGSKLRHLRTNSDILKQRLEILSKKGFIIPSVSYFFC
jgi:hypothetical protein